MKTVWNSAGHKMFMFHAPVLYLSGVQHFRGEVSLNVNGPWVGQAIVVRDYANELQFPLTKELAL
jgi:hypothetical protein